MLVDNHQAVRIAQGGQPMGDGKGGSALHQTIQRLLDQEFTLGIQSRGCLIMK